MPTLTKSPRRGSRTRRSRDLDHQADGRSARRRGPARELGDVVEDLHAAAPPRSRSPSGTGCGARRARPRPQPAELDAEEVLPLEGDHAPAIRAPGSPPRGVEVRASCRCRCRACNWSRTAAPCARGRAGKTGTARPPRELAPLHVQELRCAEADAVAVLASNVSGLGASMFAWTRSGRPSRRDARERRVDGELLLARLPARRHEEAVDVRLVRASCTVPWSPSTLTRIPCSSRQRRFRGTDDAGIPNERASTAPCENRPPVSVTYREGSRREVTTWGVSSAAARITCSPTRRPSASRSR